MMKFAVVATMDNHMPTGDLNLRALHLPCLFTLDTLWGHFYLFVIMIGRKSRRNLAIFRKRHRHALI